jgi:MFS family permease
MQTVIASNSGVHARSITPAGRRVIVAASLGSVLELYDFFVVGLLATEISHAFFSGVNPTAAYIFTLLGFAAGFVLRPFGALVFGRIGDRFGRKHTFLVTIVIMGTCTFGIGLIPTYAAIGIAAPLLFVAMRLMQGLALGGEFSGAVIYVAEHAPGRSRGTWVSFVILTASIGLLFAFSIVLPLRFLCGREVFEHWGWRVPFLVSSILLLVSVWVRLKLDESPEFARMKAEGTLSAAPITETFCQWRHLRKVLVAFFGVVAGQSVVWYTGQFYSLFFLTRVLNVDEMSANLLVIAATLASVPLYFFFGWLSDRIGRKPVYLAGLLLAALCFQPLFHSMTRYANPALERAHQQAPVVDDALDHDAVAQRQRLERELGSALQRHGYTGATPRPATMNVPMLVLLLIATMSFGTMTFAPSTAMLVEMFPARIRYTAMSFPYHLGSAIFGGFLPAAAFAVVAATGDIYAGLLYPVVVAGVACFVTLLCVRETRETAPTDEMQTRAIHSR